jgi:hypothetical protein
MISMGCYSTLTANPLIKLYIPYRYFARKWYGNPETASETVAYDVSGRDHGSERFHTFTALRVTNLDVPPHHTKAIM